MIPIGIVDDHAILRAGLRQVLSEEVDFRVTAEAGNGKEALAVARDGVLDVLLLDLSMPDQGDTVGHIAEQLFLSVKTVNTYRTRVLEKLHLQSNSDLTCYALKNGLIQ